MFRSTGVRFGIACELRRGSASEHAVRDEPATRRVLEITVKFPDERTSSEQSELRALVSGSAGARRAYIESMLLQAGLHHFFKQTNQGS